MVGLSSLFMLLVLSGSFQASRAGHNNEKLGEDDKSSYYERTFRRYLNDATQGLSNEDEQTTNEEGINLATCGQSFASGNRVIGGTDATLGEWPWQAQLQVNGDFFCGGSLITPTWAMTAAHCVQEKDPSKYKVTLGDVHRDKIENTEQEFGVKRIVVHPSFNIPVPVNNDIALIQLTRAATKTSFVNTVCLPEAWELVSPGTHCYISGWGQMAHPASAAIKLQQAALPVVSNRLCQLKHMESPISSAGKTAVTSAMLCAGDAGKTLKGSCFGDSGGPFVCKNAAGQWVQQGIVSWGDTKCSSKGHFSVFARVSQFREWITTVLAE